MTEPGRDEGDGHTLKVHKGGAGVPRIVEADLRHNRDRG